MGCASLAAGVLQTLFEFAWQAADVDCTFNATRSCCWLAAAVCCEVCCDDVFAHVPALCAILSRQNNADDDNGFVHAG